MKKAIVLLSGGLDSSTVLAVAKSESFSCHALSFNYGQKHVIEMEAAQRIANYFDVTEHRIITLPIAEFGNSALTDNKIAVPDYEGGKAIPITYVPARNTIFLSFALAYAEIIEAQDIFLGVSATDYSGYPDCRPEYIAAYETMANLAIKSAVEGKTKIQIHTPLIALTKAETIQLGLRLGVDYSQTISCYRANERGEACGTCDSCTYRKKGFREAGVTDPTLYAMDSFI